MAGRSGDRGGPPSQDFRRGSEQQQAFQYRRGSEAPTQVGSLNASCPDSYAGGLQNRPSGSTYRAVIRMRATSRLLADIIPFGYGMIKLDTLVITKR